MKQFHATASWVVQQLSRHHGKLGSDPDRPNLYSHSAYTKSATATAAIRTRKPNEPETSEHAKEAVPTSREVSG